MTGIEVAECPMCGALLPPDIYAHQRWHRRQIVTELSVVLLLERVMPPVAIVYHELIDVANDLNYPGGGAIERLTEAFDAMESGNGKHAAD